jgi:glycosyltransferase involved in cell wall biosynthesis
MDVVCLPDMDWDHLVWTNRQHVMYRLPKLDPTVRVLYVSSPRFVLVGKLGLPSRVRRRQYPDGQRVDGLWTQRIGDRLWILQPLLPVPNRLCRRVTPVLLDRWLLAVVRSTMRRLGFARPVLWTYTPLAAPLVGHLGERLVCYDVVDDYPSLSEYRPLSRQVASQDRELTRRADLVFFASKTLYEARKHLNPNAHLVGNAADVALFAQARAEGIARPADLQVVPGPIVGFHGTVTSSKLDLRLCRELALRRPQWSLVFVGPVQDRAARAALADLSNVYLLGAREQAELPAYLAHFAVSIIPYQRNAYTEHLNALKLYECLAAGRPIVTTDLPCFREFQDQVVIASDADSFTAAVERVLASREDRPGSAAQFSLCEFSWDAKVTLLRDLIKSALRQEDNLRVR